MRRQDLRQQSNGLPGGILHAGLRAAAGIRRRGFRRQPQAPPQAAASFGIDFCVGQENAQFRPRLVALRVHLDRFAMGLFGRPHLPRAAQKDGFGHQFLAPLLMMGGARAGSPARLSSLSPHLHLSL